MRYLKTAVFICSMMSFAHAGVSMDGTRIIFPAKSKSVNVQLRNAYDSPALVQAWIDTGDAEKIPKANEVPFVLNPSLTRVEPKKGQIIRIIPLDTSKLPKDRETIFWFNMMDIPPEDPSLKDKNHLSFTVRTRIKLFYRPTQLAMAPLSAQQGLQFKYDQATQAVQMNNPTPYYLTVVQVESGKNQAFSSAENAIMLAPFSNTSLKDFKLDASSKKIVYEVLNDLGTAQTHETIIQ
ncbi:fimbria/pilus periplasmic chaperone [Acinetobacter guillouiae]|jgi:P pilus assembly chaperone PapD|uniref:fimbrial biogenesis chaperone n=1 Tax=Acinetobacter guillouiae TaxID=106649 RepID=UPI0028D1DD18|nr:fimbria/pilus periplasmic chaperone [Acinetobacter guillouiae]